MAAATVASSYGTVFGNKRISGATLTTPVDTNSWDSGLSRIDGVFTQLNEAAVSASDAVTCTVSGGVVTLAVTGTIDSLYIMAIGQ